MLRHVNLGSYRVYLRLQPPEVECGRRSSSDCPLRLEVAPSVPYTHGLEFQFRQFWSKQRDPDLARQLFDLSSDELQQLQKISEELNPAARSTAPATASAGGASSDDLPPATDSIWQKLVNKDILLSTNNFGLQMMLSWVSTSLQNAPSESAKVAKINMLRTYFVKHRNALNNEINQLFGAGE